MANQKIIEAKAKVVDENVITSKIRVLRRTLLKIIFNISINVTFFLELIITPYFLL